MPFTSTRRPRGICDSAPPVVRDRGILSVGEPASACSWGAPSASTRASSTPKLMDSASRRTALAIHFCVPIFQAELLTHFGAKHGCWHFGVAISHSRPPPTQLQEPLAASRGLMWSPPRTSTAWPGRRPKPRASLMPPATRFMAQPSHSRKSLA